MITFNNIVFKFQEFCDNHHFIQTFSYGSPSDVDLEKFEQYPLLHLVYTGGDYNSPKAKTYNLECYILSLPPSKADKVGFQKESISDAEQVAEDILADIQNGGNIFQFGFHYDLVNASVTPLEEERSNALAGCLLDIAISVPYAYDSCNAPITGVDPEGSVTPYFKARGLLRVKELDGSPDVLSVATINVPNGSLVDDGDGEITLTFGGDEDTAEKVHFPVRNDEGATIAAGTPLYSRGEIGGSERVLVGIADASDPAKMPAIAIAETELTTTGDGKDGYAIVTGTYNTNISGFTGLQENDILYVADGGGLHQDKPTGTNLIQNVGVVLKTNGTICQGLKVSCIGRTNDVPNIPDGQAWIGNASGVATPTTLADVATGGDIDNLGDVTITTPSEGQLLYYDGAGWINKTVVGGNAVASVTWTNNATTTSIGTFPSSYTQVAYPANATVTPAGSFSLSYSANPASLTMTGLSTGTILAYTATFMVNPAVVADAIVVRLRAELSESAVFNDTQEVPLLTVSGLPVGEETQMELSGTLTIGSHTEAEIILETASLSGEGTARCKDFEITIT